MNADNDRTGSVISHFQILQRLGAGGMGVVYKAFDTRLERTVALKFLNAENAGDRQRERFLREARAASRLDHPNICPTFAIEESAAGEWFIAMGYCDGQSLRDRLKTGPLSLAQAVDVARQVAAGLAEAHARGVIHRDIKPSNIMFTGAGTVRIVDFGLAKITPSSDLTQSGGLIGTLAYMSPEQAQGGPVDARTDIYSLGVLLFQMLTGRLPYPDSQELSYLQRILDSPPLPLTDLLPHAPPQLAALVARALAKRPEDRFASAAELLDALDEVRALLSTSPASQLTQPFPSPTPPPSPSPPPPPSRNLSSSLLRRFPLLLASLAALALTLLLFAPLRQRLFSLLPLRPPLPASKHLAVLPFEVLEGDEHTHALAQGLAWQLAAGLSSYLPQGEQVWVVPMTEVRERHIRSAAKANSILGVNLVLTGSIQQTPDDITVTLSLVDAARLRQLRSFVLHGWSNQRRAPLPESLTAQAAAMLQLAAASSAPPAASTPHRRAQEAYLLGRGYLQTYDQQRHLEQAIRQFEIAAAADPQFALPYAALAEAYSIQFRLTKDPAALRAASSHLLRALNLQPALPEALLMQARLQIDRGEYAPAIASLSELLRTHPTLLAARTELARACHRAGDTQRALALLQEAVNRLPDDWIARKELAKLYYDTGNYPAAEIQFREIVRLTPNSPYAYNALGGVLQKLGRFDEAAAALEKSASLEPIYPAFSNLGVLYYFDRRYRQAAAAFDRALTIDSRNYKLWGYLADSYRQVPDLQHLAPETYAKAARQAQLLLQDAPGDADVRASLAYYLARLGENERALAEARQARQGAEADLQILVRLGLTYHLLGRDELAASALGAALRRGYPLAELRAMPELSAFRQTPAYRKIDPSWRAASSPAPPAIN